MSRKPFFSSNKYRRDRRQSRSARRRFLAIDPLESRQLMDATPIPGLSDEFTDADTITDWQRIHQVEGWNADQLNIYDINATQPGRMVQQPHTTVWYQNYRGPLSFKEVTGDFVFTTEIHVTDRDDVGGSDPDDIPGDALFSLAGAMIRTPRPITNPAVDWAPGSMAEDGTNNGENYVFLSAGYGNGANQFALEVKTTRNSNSQLELTPLGASANTVTVQIARIGSSIVTLYQLPGQDWQVHRRYSRPDMPATLQVGLVTYTDWNKASDYDPFTQNSTVLTPGIGNNPTPGEPFNPDLTAGFEFARYAQPDVPAALVGADLANPAEATDAELLSFLGDNANLEPGPVEDTPLLSIQLTVIDAVGNPVQELQVGAPFTLRATVDDLRGDGTGVFSAFLDVVYDGSRAIPTGAMTFGDEYINAREGDASAAGVIDETGAIATADPLGGAPRVLFSIPMVATAAGEMTFAGDPADLLPDHEVTVYGRDLPVPAELIDFVSTTVTIVPAIPPATAVDDEITVYNDSQPVSLDVLANDSDNPAVVDSLTIISVTEVANGVVTINTDGDRVQFTPSADYYGDTSFEYSLRDGNGQEASALVMLHVHKRWHNPLQATDVNSDQFTSPIDALVVINALVTLGSVPLPDVPPPAMAGLKFVDVNNDHLLSPHDVLVIINELIRRAFDRGSQGGEGESAMAPMMMESDATQDAKELTPASIGNSEVILPVTDNTSTTKTRRDRYSKRITALDAWFAQRGME